MVRLQRYTRANFYQSQVEKKVKSRRQKQKLESRKLSSCIYASLIGTPYERKCPDLLIDGMFYEAKSMLDFEGNPKIWEQVKSAIENHIKKAKQQADNIILELPNGISQSFFEPIVRNYLNLSHKQREIIIISKNRVYIYNNSR